MGFAAEAGLLWGGGRGRFASKKGVTLHPRATDFREKKAVFFGGGGKGGVLLKKKGVTLHPRATDFQEKKILHKLNTYCKLLTATATCSQYIMIC
jgi:hypothetical protein